ncbi:hypothetical protein ACIA47_17370 [Micromonospora sp. NPDC051227]|uniref:hypothetical protein n=1 Tax=Micromonospora sp. NPDC051227 TaxID=3364285 RepID=UPI0037A6A126
MSVSHGWHVIGVVDIREPGSHEILFQNAASVAASDGLVLQPATRNRWSWTPKV